MKLQKVLVTSLLYIIAAIVLALTPVATAYGAFDYYRQCSVDGVSAPEFWVVFLLGFLFSLVLIASVSFAIAVFKLATSAREALD